MLKVPTRKGPFLGPAKRLPSLPEGKERCPLCSKPVKLRRSAVTGLVRTAYHKDDGFACPGVLFKADQFDTVSQSA